MESPNRKDEAVCDSDSSAIHVPPRSPINIGANVSMPLHFLSHPIGYSVPLLWRFPASLQRCVWTSNMAARTVFPRSVCRNGYSHFVGSDLAPKLRSLGAQLQKNH